MKFVIFHGSLSTINDNWFPYLKTKLEYMDQTVYMPQFPIDDEQSLKKHIPARTKQNLSSWMRTFEKEVLPNIKKNDQLCFVGHSLGNLMILHVIEKYKFKLDSAIFVSPFLDRLDSVPKYYDKINSTFYKTDFDFEELKKYIPTSYTLYSNSDPYVQPRRAKHFAEVLNSSQIMVKEADHFSSSVNMNEFPLVYDLCVSRIDLTLYQKYAIKHQNEQSLLNIINSEKKVLELTPEQLAEEGNFHAQLLSNFGFATFVSNTKDWDPLSEYYEGARKLAKKGVDLTRVFIIKDKKDLEREILRKQIELDFTAGIKIYLIDAEEIEKIGCEEDFGIWDNEYVCIQHINKKGELVGGKLDSRVKSLLTAQNWRDRIIRKARRVEKLEDIF